MAERLDRIATRYLTLRYLFALTLVAALALAAQGIIQEHLRRQRHDAAVINLAGRQRMLSQELVKAALARRLATIAGEAAARGEELASVLAEWTAAHAWLTGAVGMTGVGADNSPAVAAAFAELEPFFASLRSAASDTEPSALERLLRVERGYLRRMDGIVGMYQAEAAGRVRTTMSLELGLCLVLLVALLGEATFVFRPAVRWLRAAIVDRERLREQQAINRELAAAAEVSRRIGHDLHDGVGQALTALTLQARLVENQAPAAIASRISALREGLASALSQTRAAAVCLVPIDVRVEGLPRALERLADATAKATGVECRAECAADFAPVAGDDLYRIAQEAVANAMRHGGARAIVISLSSDRGAGLLAVQDDGRGGPPGGDGVGMRSMRYRAERIGGRLSAGARDEGGWRVECRFPLVESAP